jgi:glycerol-3-phosphate acyltransferase PlsY
VFTLLFDLLKGVFAVLIFQKIYVMEMGYLAGMFAILGHNFSVWLKFKGGKGVATSLGTICAANPLIGFLAIATWLLFAFLFKYSSLAAILSFLSTNIYAYLLYKNSQEFIILISFTIFIAMLVVITHRKNILRLIKQEETKIKF